MSDALKIMVLAGGPDRERPVSLQSGAQVADALKTAGHDVVMRDMGPNDLSALDEFATWGGDVVFPIFHGRWGEGGGAQAILDERGVKYVGCRADAARRCFDKAQTKRVLLEHGLPTPRSELLAAGGVPTLQPPVVLKPNDDGSSIDLAICHDRETLDAQWAELSSRNASMLVEQYIAGPEATVSVIQTERGIEALPPIQIVPAGEFYDYAAKYERDDTQYLFDFLEPDALADLQALAVRVFEVLGVRHLGRVDVMLDGEGRPWVIEVNTLPGCTTHSLLPMAARRVGVEMPELMDRLVRAALDS